MGSHSIECWVEQFGGVGFLKVADVAAAEPHLSPQLRKPGKFKIDLVFRFENGPLRQKDPRERQHAKSVDFPLYKKERNENS